MVIFQIYRDHYSNFKLHFNSTILTREIWHASQSCQQRYFTKVQPKLSESKDLYCGILLLPLVFKPKAKKTASLNLNVPLYATKDSFSSICLIRNLWKTKLGWNLKDFQKYVFYIYINPISFPKSGKHNKFVCRRLLHSLIFECWGKVLRKIILLLQCNILRLE